MGKLPSLRSIINQVAMTSAEENKTDPNNVESGPASKEAAESQLPSENLQRGVHDVEAVTLSWSKASLIAVFIKCVLILNCS